MSSTNKTTYYELPQFVDNDIFNPLVDDNDAYDKIDTALHNIADAEANDASEIVNVKSRLDSAEGAIDTLEAQNGDSVLTTTAQTLSGAVNELDGDVNSLDGRLDIVEDDINNASTGLKVKIATAENDIDALETQNGNETLTTVSQTLSGGVNELKGISDNLNSDVDVINEKLPKLLYKELITNNITKYNYSGYCIYVVKVKAGAKPKVYGTANGLHNINDVALAKNASICLNGCVCEVDGTPTGNLIVDDEIIVARPTHIHQTIAFKNNGEMSCFDNTHSAADIKADGYTNAIDAWGSLVLNGVVDSASLATINDPTAPSQQNIATDMDNNYYIITTSYNCPLNKSDMATWIADNIPNIKNAASLDGGGSATTVVNGIQLNSISDFVTSYGRPLNGIIYFENENSDVSDKSIMGLSHSIALLKTFFNPVQLLNNYSYSNENDPGWELYNCDVFQLGNLVIGHGFINITDQFPTGAAWHDIMPAILPRIVGNAPIFPIIRSYTSMTGRISINNTSPTSQLIAKNAKISMKINIDTQQNYGDFDMTFFYVTSQDKVK